MGVKRCCSFFYRAMYFYINRFEAKCTLFNQSASQPLDKSMIRIDAPELIAYSFKCWGHHTRDSTARSSRPSQYDIRYTTFVRFSSFPASNEGSTAPIHRISEPISTKSDLQSHTATSSSPNSRNICLNHRVWM
jgi:hypothetical protein